MQLDYRDEVLMAFYVLVPQTINHTDLIETGYFVKNAKNLGTGSLSI